MKHTANTTYTSVSFRDPKNGRLTPDSREHFVYKLVSLHHFTTCTLSVVGSLATQRQTPGTDWREQGFSLIELIISVLVMGAMFAIALPAGKAALDSLELGNATREVERELQTARMRAVSANRPMRVKLNRPEDGQYRLVEVTGVVATDGDGAGSRCDEALYGFPGPETTTGPPRSTMSPSVVSPPVSTRCSVPSWSFHPTGRPEWSSMGPCRP